MNLFIDKNNIGWLRVMTIYFRPDGQPWKISATNNDDPISTGWYNIESETDLQYVCIPALEYNMKLLMHTDSTTYPQLTPSEKRNIETYLNNDSVIDMVDGLLNKL